MYENLYNADLPLCDLGIDVPDWIDQDITTATVAAILEGGCDSGAYMPAVTYHDAAQTMAEYGDDVLDFLEGYAELSDIATRGMSWSGLACAFLSAAVDSWAHAIASELEDAGEGGYWDRDDIIEAHYWYAANYHSGQGSDLYTRFCRIVRYFKPGANAGGPSTENAQAIYNALALGGLS